MLGDILKGIGVGEDKLDDAMDKINEAIEARIEEAVTKLKAKNGELIGKLKEAKRGAGDGPDLSDYEEKILELQDQMAKINKESSKKVQALEKELEQAKGMHQSESQAVARLVIDRGLTDALMASGVDEKHLPILREYHKARVQVIQEGDERKAVYKAADGDKPLAEYLKTWAETEGKSYVKAPVHQGGPVFGGRVGSMSGKKMTLTELSALDGKEQAKFFAQGGQLLQE
jgi:hypothetical protein